VAEVTESECRHWRRCRSASTSQAGSAVTVGGGRSERNERSAVAARAVSSWTGDPSSADQSVHGSQTPLDLSPTKRIVSSAAVGGGVSQRRGGLDHATRFLMRRAAEASVHRLVAASLALGGDSVGRRFRQPRRVARRLRFRTTSTAKTERRAARTANRATPTAAVCAVHIA